MTTLIADLDNTLYDWVTYFATAFDAMLQDLEVLLGVPRAQLISEFKEVHRRNGSSEKPFSALEIASVRLRFGDLEPTVLMNRLEGPFATFDAARQRTLRLYPGVRETLANLRGAGVTILAHTEAPAVNAYHRLVLLGVADCFDRVYVRDGSLKHLDPRRQATLDEASMKIRVVRPQDRKPAPRLLLDICQEEMIDPDDAWYVGDSLTRDIAMANAAGVRSIWAKYGTYYDRGLWDLLVLISHWTDDDVAREAALREALPHIHPDFTITSFAEVEHILGTVPVAHPADKVSTG
jgi:FMN phosphatase YigB (HAD superfamily)